jgi:hypothetical protein
MPLFLTDVFIREISWLIVLDIVNLRVPKTSVT